MNGIRKKQRNIYRKEFRYSQTDDRQQDALLSIVSRRFHKKGYLKKRLGGDRDARQRQLERQETPASLCEKFQVKLPESFDEEFRDLVLTDVSYVISMAEEGGALLLANRSSESYGKILRQSEEIGVAVIFADEEMLAESGADIGSYPIISVPDGLAKFRQYYRPYRDAYDGIVVGVTGSTGKTTTKEYIRRVASQDFDTFASPSNKNSTHNIADNVLNKMGPNYQVFVQEVGGGSIGAVESSAQILSPDISVITNVMPHHLDKYKTLENVFADKIQLVKQLRPGGIAIVNFDDENLAGFDYPCKLVSFGIHTDRKVDYRAEDIHQDGEILTFHIVTDQGSVPAKAKIVGEYNAYNILAAFALGKCLGMKEDAILRGIESYSTTGSRQNVDHFGSNTFFMDCYNVCNETIVGSMRVLEKLPVPEGSRRIAVIGGENKLGELRVEKTEELGRMLAKIDVDEIVCYGSPKTTPGSLNRFGDPRTLYRSLKEHGFENTTLITSFGKLVKYLKKNVRQGDAALFKCIVYLNMPAAVDKAFGTGYSLESEEARKGKGARPRQIDGFTGFQVRNMLQVYLTDVSDEILSRKHLVIPDTFRDRPVFGVNRGLFAFCDAETIDFGKSLRHIGIGAFHGCRRVKQLQFPDSLAYIRAGAFRDCKSLEKVSFGKGIRQIDAGAFDGCSRLKEVVMPSGLDVRIESGAFPSSARIIYS